MHAIDGGDDSEGRAVPGIDRADWMRRAIADARLALDTGDVPVAAIVLDADGRVLFTGDACTAPGEACGDAIAMKARFAASAVQIAE